MKIKFSLTLRKLFPLYVDSNVQSLPCERKVLFKCELYFEYFIYKCKDFCHIYNF